MLHKCGNKVFLLVNFCGFLKICVLISAELRCDLRCQQCTSTIFSLKKLCFWSTSAEL